jgi:hypothetical protein
VTHEKRKTTCLGKVVMRSNVEKKWVDNTYKPPAPLGSTPWPPGWAIGCGHDTPHGTDAGMMHVTPVVPDTCEGVIVGCSLRACGKARADACCVGVETHSHLWA